MKNIFKKMYRVVEKRMGDDTSGFYPQERICWIWIPLKERGANDPANFKSLTRSNRFLYELYQEQRGKTVVDATTHHFNEVFYKLSQKADK